MDFAEKQYNLEINIEKTTIYYLIIKKKYII